MACCLHKTKAFLESIITIKPFSSFTLGEHIRLDFPRV
jgi:hypothetical protein